MDSLLRLNNTSDQRGFFVIPGSGINMVYIIILLLLEINFLTESYFQESNGSDKRNVKLCFNVVDAIPMIHLIYWLVSELHSHPHHVGAQFGSK